DADEDGGGALFVAGEATERVGLRRGGIVESAAEDVVGAAVGTGGRRDGHEVAVLEMWIHADPLALGFGAGFFLEFEFLGGDAAVDAGADEFVVFEAAAVAVEADAHALARA